MIFIIFRIIRKGYIIIRSIVDIAVTKLLFKINRVDCSSIFTNGIPIIDIDRSGGKMAIGPNFRMNNSCCGNVIGFNTPCVFHIEDGASIIIGKDVGMSQTTLIAMDNITINDNVKIGGGKDIHY